MLLENGESIGKSAVERKGRIFAAVLLALLLTSLVGYKSYGAMQKLREVHTFGTLRLKTAPLAGAGAAQRSVAYLRIVWPALLFGVLISGAVRVALPTRALVRVFGEGAARGQLSAALAGAPLMLCSCCAAPLFPILYRRTGRMAPALAVTTAAPSLNPAALILSFMLFPVRVATARVIMALVLVLLATLLVAHLSGNTKTVELSAREESVPAVRGYIEDYLRSVAHVAIRTVPWIVLGIWISMLITERFPVAMLSQGSSRTVVITVVALAALLVTLPTFFEIPLALSILGAGAPIGAAVVVLFAGPATNLASLLVIARLGNWRTAILLGASVWSLSTIGGLLLR